MINEMVAFAFSNRGWRPALDLYPDICGLVGDGRLHRRLADRQSKRPYRAGTMDYTADAGEQVRRVPQECDKRKGRAGIRKLRFEARLWPRDEAEGDSGAIRL